MDETQIKHVIEAALLAAGRPLTLDRLVEIFAAKGDGPDRATLKQAVEALAKDYEGRGIEIKEVATGYRVQVRNTMTDWLQPLWEERAPRYTRALLETLALVAYRQPITRAEIEEVRGVVVSTNIVRTLLERNWIRVVGHRDVPGKPAMFGTTKDFLDYFGLKKLEDLPTLAELKDGLPELSPQTDLLETLEADARGVDAVLSEGEGDAVASVTVLSAAVGPIDEPDEDDAADDDSELAGADLLRGQDADDESTRAGGDAGEDPEDANVQSAEVIPLRATEGDQ
jgi:segregation and condensation protein B